MKSSPPFRKNAVFCCNVLVAPCISSNHGNNDFSSAFDHCNNAQSSKVSHLHAQHILSAGVAEFHILWSLNVKESCHEDITESHVFSSPHFKSVSKIFSKAFLENFQGIIVVLLVVHVAMFTKILVLLLHASKSEPGAVCVKTDVMT